MLHFLFQVVCYLCIGALSLILFARRWPECYVVEESDYVNNIDSDALRRFFSILFWPAVLLWYIFIRIHDLFTWIFNLSIKPVRQKLETEEQRAQVEAELRALVQSRAKAEEEILTNKLQ